MPKYAELNVEKLQTFAQECPDYGVFPRSGFRTAYGEVFHNGYIKHFKKRRDEGANRKCKRKIDQLLIEPIMVS